MIVLESIVTDAIHLDRKWRQLTEGHDQENKDNLSYEKQVELGYYPDLKKKYE